MANLQDFRRETGVPLAACVSTAIWFIYSTLCGRTRTDRCRVIKAAWTHVCTENINVKNCLYSNYTAVHRAAGFRATHAENQPGFSASRAAGAKSGARNPVRYEEPWETWYTVDSRPSQREGIKTQTMSGENEKKKKRQNMKTSGRFVGDGEEKGRARAPHVCTAQLILVACVRRPSGGVHTGEEGKHWLTDSSASSKYFLLHTSQMSLLHFYMHLH